MILALAAGQPGSVGFLVAAAVILYFASRLAVLGIARADGSDPGRLALGQWLPIATTALAAILMRQPEIAVAVIFGSSVVLLSLVLGLTLTVAPLEALPPQKKVWPFVLPAALLPLMAGFREQLTWWHALLMLLLGAAVLSVWLERPRPVDLTASSDTHGDSAVSPSGSTGNLALAALGVLLAAGGAYLAVRGTRDAAAGSRVLSAGLIATVILSLVLILPTLGTSMSVAQHGQTGRAITSLVGAVLLNLCLLLPVVVLVWYGLMPVGAEHSRSVHDYWVLIRSNSHGLPYPMGVWRIDTVIVVLLGFCLVPVAMGRWMLGRVESLLLVLGYVLYLAADIWVIL